LKISLPSIKEGKKNEKMREELNMKVRKFEMVRRKKMKKLKKRKFSFRILN